MAMRMNGNLQLMGLRRWGHLLKKTETWGKGGTQESMGVTLAVTHNTGDMEPGEVVSCGQAGIPTHPQNFQPQTYRVYKKCSDWE